MRHTYIYIYLSQQFDVPSTNPNITVLQFCLSFFDSWHGPFKVRKCDPPLPHASMRNPAWENPTSAVLSQQFPEKPPHPLHRSHQWYPEWVRNPTSPPKFFQLGCLEGVLFGASPNRPKSPQIAPNQSPTIIKSCGEKLQLSQSQQEHHLNFLNVNRCSLHLKPWPTSYQCINCTTLRLLFLLGYPKVRISEICR